MHTYSICFQLFPFKHRLIADKTVSFKILQLRFACLPTPEDAMYTANIKRGIDTSGVVVLKYPKFTAICMAAKDCKGLTGGFIQGTKGCIRSMSSPNFVGEVRLELNDGTVEIYDDHGSDKRWIPEFHAFIKAVTENNFDFCRKMLDASISVSELQTKLRLDAGIRFPADDEYMQ